MHRNWDMNLLTKPTFVLGYHRIPDAPLSWYTVSKPCNVYIALGRPSEDNMNKSKKQKRNKNNPNYTLEWYL